MIDLEAHSATVRDWIDIVRRIRFGRSVPAGTRSVAGATVRAVALMLATYADSDGSRCFPGVARLAVACELDYRTTRRALAALRDLGLITPTGHTGRRRGDSTTYQLTIPPDLLDRVEVLSPSAMAVEAERIRCAARRTTDRGTGATRTPTHGPVRVPHTPVPPVDTPPATVDNPVDSHLVRVSHAPVPTVDPDPSTGARSTPVRVLLAPQYGCRKHPPPTSTWTLPPIHHSPSVRSSPTRARARDQPDPNRRQHP